LWSMPGCCPAIYPCSLGCSDEERYQANSAPSPIMRHLIHQARHEKSGIKTSRRTSEEALIRRVSISINDLDREGQNREIGLGPEPPGASGCIIDSGKHESKPPEFM
jgi:hypothetical protein